MNCTGNEQRLRENIFVAILSRAVHNLLRILMSKGSGIINVVLTFLVRILCSKAKPRRFVLKQRYARRFRSRRIEHFT